MYVKSLCVLRVWFCPELLSLLKGQHINKHWMDCRCTLRKRVQTILIIEPVNFLKTHPDRSEVSPNDDSEQWTKEQVTSSNTFGCCWFFSQTPCKKT